MKLIQRGNKQLRVDDARVEDYLKAGYVEVDPETGKPISEDAKGKAAGKAKKKGE